MRCKMLSLAAVLVLAPVALSAQDSTAADRRRRDGIEDALWRRPSRRGIPVSLARAEDRRGEGEGRADGADRRRGGEASRRAHEGAGGA